MVKYVQILCTDLAFTYFVEKWEMLVNPETSIIWSFFFVKQGRKSAVHTSDLFRVVFIPRFRYVNNPEKWSPL